MTIEEITEIGKACVRPGMLQEALVARGLTKEGDWTQVPFGDFHQFRWNRFEGVTNDGVKICLMELATPIARDEPYLVPVSGYRTIRRLTFVEGAPALVKLVGDTTDGDKVVDHQGLVAIETRAVLVKYAYVAMLFIK